MNRSMTLAMPLPDDGGMAMDLNISNIMTDSVNIYPFIQMIGHKLHLSQACVSSMLLAIEEQLLNLIRYAYPQGEEGMITLKVLWHKATSTLHFSVIDHGVAYNPTAAPDNGTDRQLGAKGINMLSQLMDTVDYVRRAGANVLNFTKKIVAPLHAGHNDEV